MGDTFTFANIKKQVIIWAGAISANGDAKDLIAAAITAQERATYALNCGEFMQTQNSTAYQKLMDANKYLGEIIGYYKKGEKVYKDLKAVQKIHEAIQVLKDDQIIYQDPAAAARAFDQLFVGFGTLAKKFPPPFDSTIGEFLVQCGTLHFFENMERVMAGPQSNLGRAKQLLYDQPN